MGSRTCAQCGHPLPDEAKFCGQCGAVSDIGPPTDRAPPPSPDAAAPMPNVPPAGRAPLLGKTMMEYGPAAPAAPPAAATPALPPAGAALAGTFVMDAGRPPAAAAPTTKKTMIGVSSADLFGGQSPAPRQPFAPPAAQPVPSPQPIAPIAPAPVVPASAAPAAPAAIDPRGDKRTMIGVAMPGIAPTAAPTPAAPVHPSRAQTMMGVAIPGIAPLHPGQERTPPPAPTPIAAAPVPRTVRGPAPPPVDIVPAPPPLVYDEPAPAAPVVVRKRGFPIAIVAVVVAVVLLCGAGAIVFFWRSAPPLAAQPRVDEQGKDVVRLTCESCKDGTTASLNGRTATFKAGESDLPLAVPLKVGDNPLAITIDRPGMGRDETVTIPVHVAFRIRADLETLKAPHPAITVRVEALPGTDVRVDDKPLALDGSGQGAYAVDLTSDTEGPSDESTVINKSIPYVVTPKGGQPEKGTVAARVSVVPLRVDTPGAHAVIDTTSFVVSGRAAKGSQVTIDGKVETVSPEGFFEDTIASPAPGTTSVEVSASAAGFAPRTVHLSVKHVQSLDAEAKTLDAATSPGYDAIMADPAHPPTGPVVIDGEVIESRVLGHRTVVLVNDTRGCGKPPCVARVVVTHEEKLAPGDVVKAYGRITRMTTASGKTVPDVEADFVVKGAAKRW